MSFFKEFWSVFESIAEGVSDAVGEGASRALCFVGSHDWSSWSYKQDGECSQVRRCRRTNCFHSETREQHPLSDFAYTAPDKCDQARSCGRCDKTEARVEHERWSGWKYAAEAGCQQNQTCARCGEVHHRTEHVWRAWEYAGPRTCNLIRHCNRCAEGSEHIAAPNHNFVFHHRVNCQFTMHHCERCGEPASMPRWETEHDFGEWKKDPERGFLWRECKACDETEIKD